LDEHGCRVIGEVFGARELAQVIEKPIDDPFIGFGGGEGLDALEAEFDAIFVGPKLRLRLFPDAIADDKQSSAGQ
jgi:hypothetical protein